MPDEAAAAPARVFFALWPDEAVADTLFQAATAARDAVGGRRMRRETLHLTLAFIGAVPPQRIEALKGVAAAVRNPAFTLRLDRLRGLPRKQLAWIEAASPPPALAALAAELHARLAAAGFPLETRPFAGHVTLLRNAREAGATAAQPPIEWPVRDFVLVQSHLDAAGASYRRLGRWALDAAE